MIYLRMGQNIEGAIDTLGAAVFMWWIIVGLFVAVSVGVWLIWKMWYYMARNMSNDIARARVEGWV